MKMEVKEEKSVPEIQWKMEEPLVFPRGYPM